MEEELKETPQVNEEEKDALPQEDVVSKPEETKVDELDKTNDVIKEDENSRPYEEVIEEVFEEPAPAEEPSDEDEKAEEGKRYREIQKDFVKLANPKENKVINENTGETENSIRYFVHTVISYDDKQKIENRLKEAYDVIDSVIGKDAVPVNYVLYSLCRDDENDNQYIAADLSPSGEIGKNIDPNAISLHWYDEQTKEIKP